MLEEIADEFALRELYQDLVMREEQDSHAKMDENHQPQKALRDSLDKLKDKEKNKDIGNENRSKVEDKNNESP